MWVDCIYLVDDYFFFVVVLVFLINMEVDMVVCGYGCEVVGVFVDFVWFVFDIFVMDVNFSV